MSEELTTYTRQLPDTVEDIARFLLIAPERVAALSAEIRAIKKAKLAQEVYNQKLDEQRQLAELILDASEKMGEFTKAMPKASKGNQYTGKMVSDTAVADQKSKTETIRDLGFTPKQVERFETLADNADLVEQVKAEARENGTIPTRTKVLDLAQERKKRCDADLSQIDRDYDNLKLFKKAVEFAGLFRIAEDEDEILDSVIKADSDLPHTIKSIETLIHLLSTVKCKLITKGAQHGKKSD